MKKIIVFIIYSSISLCYGQDLPRFNLINGTKNVIINVGSKSAKEIYKKSVDWVNLNYKNPNEVVDEKIENQMIRINCFQSNFCFKNHKEEGKIPCGLNYIIHLQFKDGKYKVGLSPEKIIANGEAVPFSNIDYQEEIDRNSYVEAKKSFEKSINELSKSLYNHITNNKSDDSW